MHGAGPAPDWLRAAGCAQHARKARTMDGSNLIFIGMTIVVQICLCTGVARRSPPVAIPQACPGTLTGPAGPSSGRTPIRHHLIRAAARSLLLTGRR